MQQEQTQTLQLGLALIEVIITNVVSSSNNSKKASQENAKVINDIKLEITSYYSSTDEKIKTLTEEVRKHNNFAERMPSIEQKIDNLEEKVNYFHKIEDAKIVSFFVLGKYLINVKNV